MSYWLEDATGKYLGDFATNVGIIKLRGIGPNLDKFLEAGEVSEELAKEVVKDVIGHRVAGYVAEMLQQKEIEFPVIITDGLVPDSVENEDEDEDEEELDGED